MHRSLEFAPARSLELQQPFDENVPRDCRPSSAERIDGAVAEECIPGCNKIVDIEPGGESAECRQCVGHRVAEQVLHPHLRVFAVMAGYTRAAHRSGRCRGADMQSLGRVVSSGKGERMHPGRRVVGEVLLGRHHETEVGHAVSEIYGCVSGAEAVVRPHQIIRAEPFLADSVCGCVRGSKGVRQVIGEGFAAHRSIVP
ncbi:hypothetical protein HQQ80_18895 [Microbacteriaceae bacterium VKM Ac-2855]|nr:hypothetical protein [Microbacteriaceae bacterium VKM Ac-2855]